MVKEKDDREYSLEERLKSYFDRRSKVGKLDSALLFLSSSTGLVFTVVQVTTSASRIAFFLPIVLLGWGLPFYYGYVLGGIVRDSAIDRLRGWIFFIAGLGSYSWMLATLWLNQIFQTGALSPYFPALISIPILIVLALRKDRFRDFIFETVGQDYTTISSKAAKSCILAALFFAVAGIGLLTYPPVVTVYSVGYFGTFGLFLLRRSSYFATRANDTFSEVTVQGTLYQYKMPKIVVPILNSLFLVTGFLTTLIAASWFDALLIAIFGGISLAFAVAATAVDRLFGVRKVIRFSRDSAGHYRVRWESLKRRLWSSSATSVVRKELRKLPFFRFIYDEIRKKTVRGSNSG